MDLIKHYELNVLEERLAKVQEKSQIIKIDSLPINKSGIDFFKNTYFTDGNKIGDRQISYVSGFISKSGDLIPTYLFQGEGDWNLSPIYYREFSRNALNNNYPSLFLAITGDQNSDCFFPLIVNSVSKGVNVVFIPMINPNGNEITVYSGSYVEQRKLFLNRDFLVVNKSTFNLNGQLLAKSESIGLTEKDILKTSNLDYCLSLHSIKQEHPDLYRKILEPLSKF